MITKPRRPRLSTEIVSKLVAKIIDEELPTGSMLSTESQFCEQFGVSRTVVREAMAQLERLGLVWIRQGYGTVVFSRDHWHELDPDLLRIRAEQGMIGDILPDLLAIRRLVEVQSASEAAHHRTETDVSRLASLIAAMDASVDLPLAYNDADISFHNALLAATGNDLLLQLMRPINELRRIGSVITASRARAIVLDSMSGHRAIFAAIAKGDPSAARDAMASHIAQFERDMLEALPPGERISLDATVKKSSGSNRSFDDSMPIRVGSPSSAK